MMNIRLIQKHMVVLWNKELKGSITVEAAFSFTLTVFVIFLMIGPLLIVKNTSDIMLKMDEMSKSKCIYELVKRNANKLEMFDKVKDYINEKGISDKTTSYFDKLVNDISLTVDINNSYNENQREYRNIKWVYDRKNSIYDEDTGLVTYDYDFGFKLPYNLLNVEELNIELVNARRAFIGADGNRYDDLSTDGEYVYVADNVVNSSIYHTRINCTYLIKDVFDFEYSALRKYKNYSNRSYTKCSYCFRKIKLTSDTVCYATIYGDRYHYRKNCPLMTANVTKVPKEYIEEYNLRECSRCVKKGGK